MKPFRSERHAALDAVYPERFCCDGVCNENQGRGGCPRFCSRVENVPSPTFPMQVSELAICGFVVACCALPFIFGPWLWPYVSGVFA